MGMISQGYIKFLEIKVGPQRVDVRKGSGGLYNFTWIGTERQKYFSYDAAIANVEVLIQRGGTYEI
jgi:hypothetical protein